MHMHSSHISVREARAAPSRKDPETPEELVIACRHDFLGSEEFLI